MVCKLDAMHVQLGFSHDSARVLVHKQGLNSTYRLRALTNKESLVARVPTIYQQMVTSISYDLREPECAVFLLHYKWMIER